MDLQKMIFVVSFRYNKATQKAVGDLKPMQSTHLLLWAITVDSNNLNFGEMCNMLPNSQQQGINIIITGCSEVILFKSTMQTKKMSKNLRQNTKGSTSFVKNLHLF